LTLRQIVGFRQAVELRNATTWRISRRLAQTVLGERLVEVLGEAVNACRDLRNRHPHRPGKDCRHADYIAHAMTAWIMSHLGVLDVEADKLKQSVLAILAKDFPEPSA